MQEKTIKSVLRRKVDEWAATIEDEAVRALVLRDTIITGGAIANMLLGEPVNDFDVYFTTHETTLAVTRYYVAKFKENPPPKFEHGAAVGISVQDHGDRIKIVVKSAGIAGEEGGEGYKYFEQISDPSEPEAFVDGVIASKDDTESNDKPKFRPVFLSSNAITLSDKVQIVIRFFGSPDEIHENYDFIHCTCCWDRKTGTLRLPTAALVSLMNKRLHYKQSKYPLCSFIRTRKFLSRGWSINAGQYVKMAWDLNKLDLSDIDVLEDQMIGVDSAYFQEVIDILRKNTAEGKPIDESYLIQIIDKVFG